MFKNRITLRDKIIDYLDETVKTKRRLNKKIVKLQQEVKDLERKLKATQERADKNINIARETNREYNEFQVEVENKYEEFRKTIRKLKREIKKNEEKE